MTRTCDAKRICHGHYHVLYLDKICFSARHATTSFFFKTQPISCNIYVIFWVTQQVGNQQKGAWVSLELESISSEELAIRAKMGDQQSLNKLLERHKHEAYRIALRMLGNAFDAEEILQNALCRVVRHLNRFDASRKFRPWFLRIVTNQVRTHWHKNKLRALFLLDFKSSPHHKMPENPENQIQNKELAETLKAHMMKLPQNQREAFVLHHVEGLSFDQMEEITGISSQALRVRTHRARKALHKELLSSGVTFSSIKE